jgi:hypothetical protein
MIYQGDKRMSEKVDVILVTKTGPSERWLENLKHLPVNNLIVETSRPLGVARQNAFGKVETEFFVSLDDDAFITPSWFSTIFSFMDENVGVVAGKHKKVGFGKSIDHEINKSRKPRNLKKGERGLTVNYLGRTKLFKDWAPSSEELDCFEDYEITQHVLNKGYSWIEVLVDSEHRYDGLLSIPKKSFWLAGGMKKALPPKTLAIHAIKIVGFLLLNFVFLFVRRNRRLSIFNMYTNFCILAGVLL